MSRAIRPRAEADPGAPPALGAMLRRWDIYQRAHVEHEIRRRRWHIGPAEARRRKAQPARNRLRRQLARAA